MKTENWPERGEVVIGTVVKIFPHGGFVKLEEYNCEAMLHISEISTKWVKDVSNHLQEGKRIVAKILKVDREKGHIDLSIKNISDNLVRDKMREWKNEQRAHKLVQLAGERAGVKDIVETENKIRAKFGLLFPALEAASSEGAKVFEGIEIAPKMVGELEKIAKENIESKEVSIIGYLDLSSKLPDGVEKIKEALLKARTNSEIQYMGAPHYRIKVVAPDYKSAEKQLKEIANNTIEALRKSGGEGSFHRELKK